MAFGVRIYDDNGVPLIDYTDRVTRILDRRYVASNDADSSFTLPNVTEDNGLVLTMLAPIDGTTGYIYIGPNVYIDAQNNIQIDRQSPPTNNYVRKSDCYALTGAYK